jgi:hypothetical protein
VSTLLIVLLHKINERKNHAELNKTHAARLIYKKGGQQILLRTTGIVPLLQTECIPKSH